MVKAATKTKSKTKTKAKAKAKEGGCFCGQVRYTLLRAPLFINCCHCRDCQRQTGGAFAINAIVEASNVKVTKGKPRRTTLPTESGRPHDVYRCPACHTALWSDYGRRKVMLFLRVATLDDAAALPPDVHIFMRSKLPWDGLPRHRGATTGKPARAYKIYYDMQKEWPPESLARRAAVLGTGLPRPAISAKKAVRKAR